MSNFHGEEWANLISGYETDFEQGDQIKPQISSLLQKLGGTLEKGLLCFGTPSLLIDILGSQSTHLGYAYKFFQI